MLQITHNDQDHLHIRGEYSFSDNSSVEPVGSPPHTWRIRREFDSHRFHLRITSTYVENTCLCLPSQSALGDHLHIRGEYPFASTAAFSPAGSPPHTWRILIEKSMIKHPFRITSTYVENTLNDPRYINISQSK